MMAAIPRYPCDTAMIHRFVLRLARLLPSPEPEREPADWGDSDHSWFSSSHDLACGLNVVEHFEPGALFSDTLPSFHSAPANLALMR